MSDEAASTSARVDILGVKVSAINLPMAVATVDRWISTGHRSYVCVTGVHGVMEAQGDAELMRIHNESGLTTPDGMPMVWLGRRAGATWMDRVYGPDFMLEVTRLGEERAWRMFYYGGAPGVPDELATRLKQRFPGLVVAGCHSPPYRPLTDDEALGVASLINRTEPDIVWVGLSTPKQEQWMARFRRLLDAPVLIGVGAAFDIHAGRLQQAPPWMQRTGLEWLFRLSREPRRLWRRYLRNNPRFVWAVMRRPALLRLEVAKPANGDTPAAG